MRPFDDIVVDVFNGLGPQLPENEQLAYAFIYGEADAKARGLTHYLTDAQRAALVPSEEPTDGTGTAPEAGDSNPSPQVVGLPLLEIPPLTLGGGLPEGLLVLAGEQPEGVVSAQDADTPAASVEPVVPEPPKTALKLPKRK